MVPLWKTVWRFLKNLNIELPCCCCLVAQLCLTLLQPPDYSLLGSSVHGISQARILDWVAVSFSIFQHSRLIKPIDGQFRRRQASPLHDPALTRDHLCPTQIPEKSTSPTLSGGIRTQKHRLLVPNGLTSLEPRASPCSITCGGNGRQGPVIYNARLLLQ